MKIKIYVLTVWVLCLLFACSDFTEIDPKGKNTLSRVEDLNLLLNNEYEVRLNTLNELINDVYPQTVNIPSLLDESIKTLGGVSLTWDEKTDRAALTNSDNKYTGLYDIIGKVANPVLLNVDGATGDSRLAAQYKAEALVLRAWCHYLLVNIYAKAYDPATAATDPGIVYTRETDDIATPNEKLTVGQVYESILEDLNVALDLNSLPANPNKMRVGLPFAWAAKAKVLMSMRDYEGAFAAASESLKLKNTIDDYNQKIELGTFGTQLAPMLQIMGITADLRELVRPYLTCEEELFETPSGFSLTSFSLEFWQEVEENHLFHSYILTDKKINALSPIPIVGNMGEQFSGIDISMPLNMNLYYSPIGLTTVDMYLVQAECYIREGKTDEAMNLLNTIREKRVLTGTYQPETASTSEEAFVWLKKISRTENFYTAKTFINLKRWNTEEKYRETLHKTYRYENQERSYELRPDSPLWIFPFPQNATNLNPNLTQNY